MAKTAEHPTENRVTYSFLQPDSTPRGLRRRAARTSLQLLQNMGVNRSSELQRQMSGEKQADAISNVMRYHLGLFRFGPASELGGQSGLAAQLMEEIESQKFDRNARECVGKAWNNADIAHQDQKRKYSGQQYIIHPIRVALVSIKLAEELGVPVTPELISAALMHDTIEDSPTFGNGQAFTRKSVENLFGSNSIITGRAGKAIAADVEALSHHDVHVDGKVDEKRYYEKISNAKGQALMRRLIVKAADRIDNLLDPLFLDEGLAASMKPGAVKLRKNRIKYINETTNPEGIINLLYPEGSFLQNAVQAATDISQQTIDDPDFDPFFWKPRPVKIFP